MYSYCPLAPAGPLASDLDRRPSAGAVFLRWGTVSMQLRTLRNCLDSVRTPDAAIPDGIGKALEDFRTLLDVVRQWDQPREADANEGLRCSIRLLGFAATYKDVGSLHKLLPGWPIRRVDKNLTVIQGRSSTDPQSYGDAVFRLMRGAGMGILQYLQEVYPRAAGGLVYSCPFAFLAKTPEVGALVIAPRPDMVARDWFTRIVTGIRNTYLNEYPARREADEQFNVVRYEFDQEQQIWKGQLPRDAAAGPRVTDRFTFKPGQALFDGTDLELPSGEAILMLKQLVEHFNCVVPYTNFDPHYTSATPGTVHKFKREIVKSLNRQQVPCEVKSKTGVGYLIRACKLATKPKKRVRRK